MAAEVRRTPCSSGSRRRVWSDDEDEDEGEREEVYGRGARAAAEHLHGGRQVEAMVQASHAAAAAAVAATGVTTGRLGHARAASGGIGSIGEDEEDGEEDGDVEAVATFKATCLGAEAFRRSGSALTPPLATPQRHCGPFATPATDALWAHDDTDVRSITLAKELKRDAQLLSATLRGGAMDGGYDDKSP